MKVAESSAQVYQGRLMSPNEVRTAMYQRGGVLPHAYQQSWYLCGDVSEEFFHRVASHEKITHSLNFFRVNGNTSFAVFSLQIREQQARFLLPFASEKSVRFVEQAERTGIFMSLGKAGTNDALLLRFDDEKNQLRGLRDVAKRCSRLPFDVCIASTPKAATLDEAFAKASRMSEQLRARGVHEKILAFCRAELVQSNYFHAVFEAMKSLKSRINEMSGVDGDGASLVDTAFGLANGPLIAINALHNATDEGEQKGFSNLLKGLFGMVRNAQHDRPD